MIYFLSEYNTFQSQEPTKNTCRETGSIPLNSKYLKPGSSSSQALRDINIDCIPQTTDGFAVSSNLSSYPQSLAFAGNAYLTLEPHDRAECESVNYSSLSELLGHFNRLPTHTQQFARTLNHKRCTYSESYQSDNYFEQTSLISMIESKVAKAICFCGLKSVGAINPTGLCNKHRLCPCCATITARNNHSKFARVFHQHDWGFLTISYKEAIPLNHLSASDWWLHWNAAKEGLKALVSEGYLAGATLREELAVIRLYPSPSVQPHVHAITSTGALSESANELLGETVQAYRDENGHRVESQPSIQFAPVSTERDFAKLFHYIHKPIDLVTTYQHCWINENFHGQRPEINRAMRDLIEAIIEIPSGRIQISYFGNMRSQNASLYIGRSR